MPMASRVCHAVRGETLAAQTKGQRMSIAYAHRIVAPRASGTRFRCALMLALVSATLGGCSSTPKLMPTPNLYTQGAVNPFAEVPPALQSNKVDVLYLTDRA